MAVGFLEFLVKMALQLAVYKLLNKIRGVQQKTG